jgi:hypothetical protein
MVVVDQESHSWFLLRDEAGLVLDVSCASPYVTYSLTFRLNAHEAARIAQGSHAETEEIARLVQRDPRPYHERNGSPDLQAASLAAVKRWHATQPAA